ncbi:thioredoxin domain-containing protein [Daejeonella oryzae]|uniref:thioredoxin domain-containing protein n=1 Tax=Daejeonella oryzae TaxID=1122943 RepID=UPI00041E02B2|nr:thioredoxin domain-containing protein [Daejeonella oryzae]
MANRLIHETSPYLLQHSNNPVEWFPWGDEALEKAKAENKLILVSIGYSACHWCHVMEHESFEDGQVAEIMNRHFVCIKIDREERPDIDQIYMNAVQLMTERGGWPLNCFCLPDQRPIYGGTYFKKPDWSSLLLNLANFWNEKPEEAITYAERLTEGVRQSEKLILVKDLTEFSKKDLEEIMEPLKRSFDISEGGYNRAPKFPLPNNWQFLIRYAHLMNDDAAHVISRLTLQKMAFGGIYDQLGGGFARYSVDEKWHVPHFEKMLYDNAQLISLYSEAFQYSPHELFKNVVDETIEFVKRELTSTEGGFYSALDADSEGVEGKFYTFTKDELDLILEDESELFCIYYHVTEDGNWEEENTNILLRKSEDTELAEKLGIPVEELKEKIAVSREKVFKARSKRIRPGLDNKILAAWNGMMLKALTDAFRVFNTADFLDLALRNADFIIQNLSDNQQLKRVFDPRKNKVNPTRENAFLDDYAFVIEALIGLYEVTFDEKWLEHAKSYLDYSIQNYFDEESGMFFYTSARGEQLIARKQEIMDNVIPASNSVMAHNLIKLARFYDNETYYSKAIQMLRNVKPHIKTYPSGYSNWASLLLNEVFGVFEIAITGSHAELRRAELEKHYIPNKIVLGGKSGSLPLLQDKWVKETKIFVCENRTCKLPVNTTEEAIKQIFNHS